MKTLTYFLAVILIMLTSIITKAENLIESNSFDWNSIKLDQQNLSTSKVLVDAASDGFKSIHISLINIATGDDFVIGNNDSGVESLAIIKSGDTVQQSGLVTKDMGPGSVSLIMPHDKVTISNSGKAVVTLYLLVWDTRGAKTNESKSIQNPVKSLLVNWNDIEFVENPRGGRRNIIRQPTVMLREFEMHVTTLNEGMRSHLPHTHIDEKTILVRHGEIEEYIDGKLHEVGAGSFSFLRLMIPHGIRNIGQGDAEYYAFKWAPK
jgi:glyoxylate utilization-related uncharacterized protein